jgi:hypothetical protein
MLEIRALHMLQAGAAARLQLVRRLHLEALAAMAETERPLLFPAHL